MKTNLTIDAPLPQLLVCSHRADQQAIVIEAFKTSTQQSLELIWTNLEHESIKISQIRAVLHQLQYAPLKGQQRIWAILYADQLTLEAQNAMLKVLEDIPASTQIVLCTYLPEKILPTIHSRCLEHHPKIQNADYSTPTKFSELYDQLPSMSAATIFGLSQAYKDRSSAQELINHLIIIAHKQSDLNKKVDHLRWLLQAHSYLENNVNVRQVLEHTFFKFAGIIHR